MELSSNQLQTHVLFILHTAGEAEESDEASQQVMPHSCSHEMYTSNFVAVFKRCIMYRLQIESKRFNEKKTKRNNVSALSIGYMYNDGVLV